MLLASKHASEKAISPQCGGWQQKLVTPVGWNELSSPSNPIRYQKQMEYTHPYHRRDSITCWDPLLKSLGQALA